MAGEEKTVQKYQWIKGDNSGTIETLKETLEGFIVFESKRRLKQELLTEFMVPINSDSDILNMKTTKSIDIESSTGLSYGNSTQNPIKKVEPKNPIRILLEKQSKNNKIKIELEFDVNVPKKEVVELLQDTFEEDVKDEVIKFTKVKLNKQEIIDKVYSHLKEAIIMYYS